MTRAIRRPADTHGALAGSRYRAGKRLASGHGRAMTSGRTAADRAQIAANVARYQEMAMGRRQMEEAAPVMLAALDAWIVAFWGDQPEGEGREWFRAEHPGHPVVKAERAVAMARGVARPTVAAREAGGGQSSAGG